MNSFILVLLILVLLESVLVVSLSRRLDRLEQRLSNLHDFGLRLEVNLVEMRKWMRVKESESFDSQHMG